MLYFCWHVRLRISLLMTLQIVSKPIAVRLDNLALQFFHKVCQSNDCKLLVPNKSPNGLLDRLHQPNFLPGILCKPNRYYKSFTPCAIQHYQWCYFYSTYRTVITTTYFMENDFNVLTQIIIIALYVMWVQQFCCLTIILMYVKMFL